MRLIPLPILTNTQLMKTTMKFHLPPDFVFNLKFLIIIYGSKQVLLTTDFKHTTFREEIMRMETKNRQHEKLKYEQK